MSEIEFYGIEANKDCKNWVLGYPNAAFVVPFTYVFSLDEIKEIKADNLPWPISVKIYLNDKFNPAKKVSSFAELKKVISIAENLKDKEPRVLVSMPMRTNKNHSIFVYLAKDYVLAHDTKTDNHTVIPLDLSYLFLDSDLDQGLVYRLVNTKDGWALDNELSYEDERLAEVFNLKTNHLGPEHHVDFMQGYLSACQAKFEDKTVSRTYIPPSSGIISSSYDLGRYIGLWTLEQVIKQFARATFGLKNYKNEGLSSIDKKTLSGLHLEGLGVKSLIEKIDLHNQFLDSSPDNYLTLLKMVQTQSSSVSTWNVLFEVMNAACFLLKESNSDNLHKEKYLIDSLNPKDCFNVIRDIKFDSSQFRLLTVSEKSCSIRFQSTNFEIETFTENEQSKNLVGKFKVPNLEIDFNLEAFNLELLKDINYDRPSNYSGSTKTYAALELKDGNFITLNEKKIKIIFSEEYFLVKLKEKYGSILNN